MASPPKPRDVLTFPAYEQHQISPYTPSRSSYIPPTVPTPNSIEDDLRSRSLFSLLELSHGPEPQSPASNPEGNPEANPEANPDVPVDQFQSPPPPPPEQQQSSRPHSARQPKMTGPTHTSFSKPHVTLTFATSLDSNLSLSPGVQTALSGPLSKAMTHYLRSRHTAILIGAGTAIADNPSLNCRLEGTGGYGGSGLSGQPRPVVLDARGRWEVSEGSKCIKLASEGRGRGPWVITARSGKRGMGEDGESKESGSAYEEEKRRVVESVGGKVIDLDVDPETKEFLWSDILSTLGREGIASVMIEGGGAVLNTLLSPQNFHLVDSVIVTVAPTWLGKGGVQVCPDVRTGEDGVRVPVARLTDVKWVPLGEDVVLCGRPIIRSE